MKPSDKLILLIALRKELHAINGRYTSLVCRDYSETETPLEKQFGFVLWEVDEAIRGIKKEHDL